MTDPLTFLASIAPLQSAITIASDGGCRIKVDLPETEMGKIAKVMALRGKVFKVTIEVVRQRKPKRDEDEEYDESE
jgi:aconitase B